MPQLCNFTNASNADFRKNPPELSTTTADKKIQEKRKKTANQRMSRQRVGSGEWIASRFADPSSAQLRTPRIPSVQPDILEF
jgi:hypothetical protein